MIETKTPIITRHWLYVDEIKKNPEIKVVLVGDHVTWNPEESMRRSKADFIAIGGDYDFKIENICQYLLGKKDLEGGVWYRENSKIKNSGPSKLVEDLDILPMIDRDFTGYKFHEAYLYRPSGYIMSGRCYGGGLQGVTF